MEITRRNLFRSAAVAGGAAALGSLGGLAAEAVAGTGSSGRTTLDRVLLKGSRRTGGWRPVVAGPGERHVVRSDLATGVAGRATTRQPLLAFVQLSDVHILDAQSPLRFESAESASSSAYRPQEILTAQVAEAMVRELNQVGAGPVSGEPLVLALQTGDNSDNSQYNEIRWNIDVLDGGTIRPDSGDLERYEGVMDGSRAYYDPQFWHPHGAPRGKQVDDYRGRHGFPVVPGLLDQCRRPFAARGLDMPWYTALGNHDELVQGNFQHTDLARARAVGDQKPVAVGGVRTVTPDPDRRLLSRLETVQEHFTTTGLPEGHGFTQDNLDTGTAYYTFDQGLVRFVVMDTVNEHGGADGSLDQAQFDWLKQQLTDTTDRVVVVASHHSSWTMDNARTGPDGALRVLGEAVVDELLGHENVVAWINGHTHRNRVVPHRGTGGGGFWEINTAAHIDWPQQSRILEVMDNQDGTLSIFTTMVDHGAPLRPGKTLDGTMKLAALGRLLAANDPQERGDKRRGRRGDRNVELLLTAPGWLAG